MAVAHVNTGRMAFFRAKNRDLAAFQRTPKKRALRDHESGNHPLKAG
jgi:hypothetical protein